MLKDFMSVLKIPFLTSGVTNPNLTALLYREHSKVPEDRSEALRRLWMALRRVVVEHPFVAVEGDHCSAHGLETSVGVLSSGLSRG